MRRRGAWAAGLLLGLSAVSHAMAGPEPAPPLPHMVDLPAIQTHRAQSSVLVAVSRAGSRLVAAGERGYVVLSDDDGRTWRQASVPTSVTLTALSFPTSREGWAVGHSGIVLHSKDGGETWIKQLDGAQAATLVLAEAERKAKPAESDGRPDPALASAQLLVQDGADKPFLDVHFKNEREGFVVGAYGLAFRTGDGGATWRPWQDHIDNPGQLHLFAIRAAGERIFLVGEQGYAARSDDGGGQFVRLEMPYPGTFYGVQPAGDGHVIVFGLKGHAFSSGDGGHHWRPVETGLAGSIDGGTLLQDGAIALVSDRGDLLLSRDRGATVTALPVPNPFPFAAVTQAADGALVLTGTHGVNRLPL